MDLIYECISCHCRKYKAAVHSKEYLIFYLPLNEWNAKYYLYTYESLKTIKNWIENTVNDICKSTKRSFYFNKLRNSKLRIMFAIFILQHNT